MNQSHTKFNTINQMVIYIFWQPTPFFLINHTSFLNRPYIFFINQTNIYFQKLHNIFFKTNIKFFNSMELVLFFSEFLLQNNGGDWCITSENLFYKRTLNCYNHSPSPASIVHKLIIQCSKISLHTFAPFFTYWLCPKTLLSPSPTNIHSFLEFVEP